MKRLLFTLAAATLLTSVGCVHHNTCNNCGDGCGNGGGLAGHGGGGGGLAGHGGGGLAAHGGGGLAAHGGGGGLSTLHNPNRIPPLGHHNYPDGFQPQGPQTAQVTYPYYTTRGPRDFLMDNPNSIGP